MLYFGLNNSTTKYLTQASQLYRDILKDASKIKKENTPDDLKKLFEKMTLSEGQ